MSQAVQPTHTPALPETLPVEAPTRSQPAAVPAGSRLSLIVNWALFVGLAFGLVHGLAWLADSAAPDGTTLFLWNDQHHVDQVLHAPEPLEALAVGNSHTAALNLSALGYVGHTVTRADSDYFESDYLLREVLLPGQPSVQTVFVPVSYFSFHWDSAAAEETRVRRWHMYAVSPVSRFLPGDFDNFAAGKALRFFPVQSVAREDHWQGVWEAWLGNPPEHVPVEIAEDDCRFLPPAGLNEQVAARAARTTRLLVEMAGNHRTAAADLYQALADTIGYLQAHGVRVVLFTPPYYASYNGFYVETAPDMLATMASSVHRLQADYGVAYYDFSADPDFTRDHTLFADADHLNGCGAQLFSEKFRQALAVNAQ
jgi:hypothetical protein